MRVASSNLRATAIFAAAPLSFATGNSTPSDHQQPQNKQMDNNAESKPNTANKDQSNSAESNNQAPEGFVRVEEDLVMLTASQPEVHFVQAENDLSSNDHKAAASELRLASSYMDMQP
jgi:hypothetical protein